MSAAIEFQGMVCVCVCAKLRSFAKLYTVSP